MTAFAALTRPCPPPEEASRRPIDWHQVEGVLGVPLPEDCKRLACTYGPGSFADYVRIYQPDGVTEWVDLTGPVPARIREQPPGQPNAHRDADWQVRPRPARRGVTPAEITQDGPRKHQVSASAPCTGSRDWSWRIAA